MRGSVQIFSHSKIMRFASCMRMILTMFMVLGLASGEIQSKESGNSADADIVGRHRDGYSLGHKIESKKSILMCGEFFLPTTIFSFASKMGQVSPGSCASKGFNQYETSTSLNMGFLGSINVNVYKQRAMEEDIFKSPFGFNFQFPMEISPKSSRGK